MKLEPIWLGAPLEEELPSEFTVSTWNVWFDRFRREERNTALLAELEGYRRFDPTTGPYHEEQTRDVPAGHLTFVMQGDSGALSLMLVLGRSSSDLGDEERTMLVRATD